MRIFNEDHRFSVQQIERSAWVRATVVNAASDYLFGYQSVVDEFLTSRPESEFRILHGQLRDWSHRHLCDYVEANEHESLIMLVMMLTGTCNANCDICFTDRHRRAYELEPDERDRVLRQAHKLGARFVYVPGEGEPTIDGGFWQFLNTCRDLGLEAVVFTNGIILSDSASCRKYWELEPDAVVRRLQDYPVSLYLKFWSTNPEVVSEMTNVPAELYHYTRYDGILVPAGLARLLDALPRDRVGIEVVVEKRNADEVIEKIVPFAEEHSLPRIVEMIQHNGRVLNDGCFDPTPDQRYRAMSLLSPTSCSMATCMAVVTSCGFLSPRIAILEHQIPGKPVSVRSGSLFQLLHSTDYLSRLRYDIVNCLCEKIPMDLASTQADANGLNPINIMPTSLSSSAMLKGFGPRCRICNAESRG